MTRSRLDRYRKRSKQVEFTPNELDAIFRISIGERQLDRKKLTALAFLRHHVLDAIRTSLRERFDYYEATLSTLVNIAGSCENPDASFKVDYYGRPAYLSQSAQLQLEALVLRLNMDFFTVNTSFREEHFNDPEDKGRRLSEFTLIEAEANTDYHWRDAHPRYVEDDPQFVLQKLIFEQKIVLSAVLEKVLADPFRSRGHMKGLIDSLCPAYTERGSQQDYLQQVLLFAQGNIAQWTYDEALERLNASELRKTRARDYQFGDDLGTLEERELIRQNEGMPLFVTHHPASLKFFNMKRTYDGQRVYSVDLLMPPLGEVIGGAVREEDPERIKEQLQQSRVGAYMREQGIAFPGPFAEYLRTLEDEVTMSRAGYGIGFERLIGFLIGSTDILDTVAYRTLQP